MSFFYSIYFAPATDVSAEAISAICSAGAENRRIVGATLDQAVLQVDDMKVFTPPTLVAAEVFDATIQSRPLSSCAFRFLGSE